VTKDTWQDLERRFHEIGNRTGKVVLGFGERDSERFWWTLSGPVADGEYRMTIIGGSTSETHFGTEHYSINEICELMRRAGKFLVDDDPNYIWTGADLFVAMTIRAFRIEVCSKDGIMFFPNAGRILGMMVGKLILKKPDSDDQIRIRARKIIEMTPNIKQRQFCRELGISDETGGDIYRALTGKEKQRRNRN